MTSHSASRLRSSRSLPVPPLVRTGYIVAWKSSASSPTSAWTSNSTVRPCRQRSSGRGRRLPPPAPGSARSSLARAGPRSSPRAVAVDERGRLLLHHARTIHASSCAKVHQRSSRTYGDAEARPARRAGGARRRRDEHEHDDRHHVRQRLEELRRDAGQDALAPGT